MPTLATPSAAARVLVLTTAVLILTALSAVTARDAIERSPYGPLAYDMLQRLYATPVDCDVALDPATRCFVIVPGTVASVAEAIERLTAEYGGSLQRSEWRSANGVHHVELRLSDDLWGALELWLTEPDGQIVAGRLLHQPKRRNGAP